MGGGVRGFLSFLVDALVPRSCLACGRELGSIDPGAQSELRFASFPRVAQFLAADLAFELGAGISVPASVLCPGCWMRLEPAGTWGRLERSGAPGDPVPTIAPFFTNDELLSLVRFLKYSGGRSAVPALGWWMARALGDYLENPSAHCSSAPVLVPVPLHSSREKSRGYNQAFLLAQEVAVRLGITVESRVLGRIRNTKSQSKLDARQRTSNVEGAFSLMREDLVNAKSVILVDDLVTTGGTALACIAALGGASVTSIAVLSAGRARG
jgi:ComF family protein